MATSKKFKVVRVTKRRPYRVDWFDIEAMQGDDALVHSGIVRAVTAEEAKQLFYKLFPDGEKRLVVVRAYRFYRRLPKETQFYVAVEDLFSDVRAVEVMKQIDAYSVDLISGLTAAPASGPDSPATVAVMKDFDGMMSHDKHEQMMDTFVPDKAMTPEVASIIQAETPAAPPPAPAALDVETLPNNKFTPWPIAPEKDRTLNMMEFGMGAPAAPPLPAPAVCPTCGIGTDTDGDGNCPVCAAPAYKQPLTRNSYIPLYWALGIVIAIAGASIAYFYFIKYIGN